MSNIKISILFSTRRRPDVCSETVINLLRKSSNREKIEIILGFDNDDTRSIDKILNNLNNFKLINLKYKSFDRKGYAKLHEYFDELICLVDESSELLFFFSDDFIMETEDWDKILLEFHEKNKFGAYFVSSRHSRGVSGQVNISCILPKKWIEITGRCSAVNNTDSWMEYVAKEAKCFYNIDDISVIHKKLGDITEKQSNAAKKTINQKARFHSKDVRGEIKKDARKIRDYISTSLSKEIK